MWNDIEENFRTALAEDWGLARAQILQRYSSLVSTLSLETLGKAEVAKVPGLIKFSAAVPLRSQLVQVHWILRSDDLDHEKPLIKGS